MVFQVPVYQVKTDWVLLQLNQKDGRLRASKNVRSRLSSRHTQLSKKAMLKFSSLRRRANLKLRATFFQMPPCCGTQGRFSLPFMPSCASFAAMLMTFHFYFSHEGTCWRRLGSYHCLKKLQQANQSARQTALLPLQMN